MEAKEKYYRRAYNCLSILMDAYRNGYNKKAITNFINTINKKNSKIKYEELESLRLTLNVALLGLNKERMEATNKYSDYEKNIDNYDVRNLNLSKKEKDLIKDFENKNTVNTKYDRFLSITNNLATNYTDEDYINVVRNAFLHGQYELNINEGISTTKIKNKNFFEGEVLNPNLFYFITSYFSNLPSMGITEKNILYKMDSSMKIENDLDLEKFLQILELQYIDYETNKEYDGQNTLEKILIDKYQDKYVDSDIIEQELNNYKTDELNIKSINKKHLSNDDIEVIIAKIKEDYGESIYKLNKKQKFDIINAYVEYHTENARVLSNWLLHYFYFVTMGKDDNNFFLYDENCNFCNDMALLIVKAYLVLFRVQNKCFEEIDYSDIDLDINDLELTSFDENDNPANLFVDSFNKQKNKSNNTYSDDEIKIMVLNEVIRDALAHGNIETRFEFNSNKELIHTITLKDIYKSKKRVIKMDIDTFRKYLNSKSFLPEKCIMKDKGTSKVKSI